MYAGFESVGGPCDGPNRRVSWYEVTTNRGSGGYVITVSCNCGTTRVPLVGELPSFEQFSAQHSRAVEAA